ncbi:Cenp-O kinetochore centromere component-domain-containing protein [Syncephalis fuscata]|nr:Cenp-O kinetochore centromere component-domain-containing protein [Syncephalis fuscata]
MKRINEKKTSKNKDFIRANSLQQRVIDQISEESRIRNAAEISSAFRMTGRSLFHFSENEIGIRLETFYKGSFYETYYIRFRLKLDSNISVHNDDLNSSFIVMHTLPAFIPVDNIGRCYLTQDVLDKDELDLFLREIDLYLSSYVFRREQVKELYKQSYCCDIKVDLELCDSVQFTIRYSEREIYVKLTYDNLKIFYPSKLDAREKTPEWEYRLKQFEHNLQQYSMIDAIQKELFC